jgi:hypothetical protein
LNFEFFLKGSFTGFPDEPRMIHHPLSAFLAFSHQRLDFDFIYVVVCSGILGHENYFAFLLLCHFQPLLLPAADDLQAASAVAAQLRGAKALPDRFRASEGERENF